MGWMRAIVRRSSTVGSRKYFIGARHGSEVGRENVSGWSLAGDLGGCVKVREVRSVRVSEVRI